MRFTTKSEYAVRAIICLAGLSGEKPMQIRQIAEKEGISRFLIDQIFMKLRKSGLIKSLRGRTGGYVLAKEPKKISIGDIIKSIEGPISILKCCGADSPCKKTSVCIPHSMWRKINTDIEKVLDKAKIGALL
ncbi:MAG: Rrf2 family transcriptional regulator [Candidatus Margulisiibacteriota bacterium]